MKKNKLKIHGWYVIFILIAIIICLIAIDFSDNQNLVNYISFAATISSILLAVIAIIYSFYSNASMSKSLGALDSISKDVMKNTIEMTRATENLKVKIEEIPNFLKPIEEKTDITNSRLEQLTQGTNTLTNKNVDDELKMNFIKYTSFLGNKTLYCCLLALNKNKEFEFKKINELSTNNNESYMYGFLVASASLNFLSFDIKGTILKITYIDIFIKEHIKDITYEKARANDSSNVDFKNWESEISDIERFFDTN